MSGENDGQTDIEHRKTNLRLTHAEMQAAKQQDRETTESTPQELWETADSTSRRPNVDEIFILVLTAKPREVTNEITVSY